GSSRYTSPRRSRPMRRSSSPSGKTEPFNGPEIATILGLIKGEIVHNERKYIDCASDSMQDRKCRSSNALADASLEAAEQHCSRRCKLGNAAAILLVFFKENLDRFKKNLETTRRIRAAPP